MSREIINPFMPKTIDYSSIGASQTGNVQPSTTIWENISELPYAISAAFSDFSTRLLNWMPNLLVAIVILVIGVFAAFAVSVAVRNTAAFAKLPNPNLVANISSKAVLILTGVFAMNQIGFASELIQILFTAVVGALALGLGLAFGLGGKDLAGELLRKWYENTKK